MLPIDIQTPGQLLSAAIAVESESIKHYADMAARMQYYGKKETVELFERLARESLQRKDQIVEWAELEGIELTELAEKVVWEDPLMPTTYDAEARDPYRSTPYKTLAYAAHNADRAFHLYIHIAAMTEDQQTETYAKTLANDALNRSRLLQSRRRRAYHTEHRGLWQQQLDSALDVKSIADFYATAASVEQRLVELLIAMGHHYEELTHIAHQSGKTAERCKQKLANAESPSATPAPAYDMATIGENLHHDTLIIFTESERAFNFYDTIMAHAYDEEIMLAAQSLSESALLRLEAIRDMQHKRGIQPAA
jgi:rubrerythrin